MHVLIWGLGATMVALPAATPEAGSQHESLVPRLQCLTHSCLLSTFLFVLVFLLAQSSSRVVMVRKIEMRRGGALTQG